MRITKNIAKYRYWFLNKYLSIRENYIETILIYEKKFKVMMSSTTNLTKSGWAYLTSTHSTLKKHFMTLETQVLPWNRHNHVAVQNNDKHNNVAMLVLFRMASKLRLIHCCLYLAIPLTSSSEELSMILQISSTILSFDYVHKSYISIKKNDF